MTVADYLRFVLALAFVLALVGVFGLVLRRYGPMAGLAMSRSRGERRLSLVEVLPLDARRRLVLVRRDGVEHLLLLGMENDLVVEPGIRAQAQNPVPDSFAATLTRTAVIEQTGPGGADRA